MGGPRSVVLPELLKFVFQDPGAVDAAVAFVKGLKDASILFGAMGRVFKKKPSEPFEYFAFLGACFPPLLLTDLIKGCVDGLDDMETIQDESGIRAMLLDGPYVRFTHVTGGKEDVLSLIGGEVFLEEEVDGFSTFAFAHPDDARSVQVIDDRSVLAAFAIGDLIDTDGLQSSDLMAIAQSVDALVEEIREGGGGEVKESRCGLLGHHLRVEKQGILKAIGDPSVGICPGDHFLDTAMGRAKDLFGVIPEEDTPSAYGEVSPHPG